MANDSFKVKKGINLETNSSAGTTAGDLRSDGTTLKFYGSSEKTIATTDIVSGTNTGDVTLTAAGSTPAAAGASLSGQALTLQPADATNPGIVSTGAQTFAGAKTFSSTIVGSINGNAATVTTNANLSGDVSSSGNTTTIGALKVTNAMLAGSIDVTTKLNGAVPIANGGTNNASLAVTAGGTLYTDGTKIVNVGAGTSGQVLQSNGSSAPTWVTAASGGKNYITNNEFATDTTGWLEYDDGSSATPVDGYEASPSSASSIQRNTTNPLRGTADLLFTHTAADNRGEGFAYAFTIDDADKGKVLQGNFNYKVASGTYADDDLHVWIYDVTNATLIQPAPYKIKNSGIIENFPFEFQTSSSSTSYRLIVHVATSTATAYTMQFDNFSVGPNAKLYGSPVTDWKSFTPTGTWSTNTTYTGYWRRIGDSAEIDVQVVLSGAPDTASLSINLPSGFSLDTAKIAGAGTSDVFGIGRISDSGTGYSAAMVRYVGSATSVRVVYIDSTAAGASNSVSDVTQAAPMTFANLDTVNVRFIVPIVGWSSSVVMSSDAATNVVALRASGDAASATSGNPIIFPTIKQDTHGAYNATTGRYTCPVAGYYNVSGALTSASSATTLIIYVNAVAETLAGNLDSNGEATFSGVVNCIAGDIIDVRPAGTVDATVSALNIFKISGPAQVAASESVIAHYNTASTAKANAEQIDFTNKVVDTHSAVTTGASWKFTAPISGNYLVQSKFISGNYTGSIGAMFDLVVYKNGSRNTDIGGHIVQTTSASPILLSGSGLVRLLAGEYIDVRFADTATTLTPNNFAAYANNVSITRVGNY